MLRGIVRHPDADEHDGKVFRLTASQAGALFIRSMVETDVSIKSLGSALADGLIDNPSILMRRTAGTGGPPSIGRPTLSKTLPSIPGPTDTMSGSW